MNEKTRMSLFPRYQEQVFQKWVYSYSKFNLIRDVLNLAEQ